MNTKVVEKKLEKMIREFSDSLEKIEFEISYMKTNRFVDDLFDDLSNGRKADPTASQICESILGSKKFTREEVYEIAMMLIQHGLKKKELGFVGEFWPEDAEGDVDLDVNGSIFKVKVDEDHPRSGAGLTMRYSADKKYYNLDLCIKKYLLL